MKLTPKQLVAQMSPEDFSEAMTPELFKKFNKPVQRCLMTRKKRADRILEKAVAKERARIAREKKKAERETLLKDREEKFRSFVRAQVKRGGAWIWKIAEQGKKSFPSKFSTKSRVEAVARKFPDLTFRMQCCGDGMALAVFEGKPVPQILHEDQPLPI